MNAVGISTPIAQEVSARVHGPRLVGRWQKVGVIAWGIIWLACLAVFLLAIYNWYRWDAAPVNRLVELYPKIKPDDLAQITQYKDTLRQLGLSLSFYGGLFAGLRLLSGIPYFLLSMLIMRRRSDRLMALLFAVVLAVIGAAGRWIMANWLILPGEYPWLTVPIMLLNFILDCSVILFYTFPDGRFVPRWTRWIALAAVVFSFSQNILANTSLSPYHLLGPLAWQINRVFLLIGLIALIIRYRRDANAMQKQQIKWIVAGSALMGFFYFAHFLFYQTSLFGSYFQSVRQGIILELILEPGWYAAQTILALCIGISVLRYRLWDIDIVINRVLVYGSLTLLTMSVYLAAVSVMGTIFRGVADPVVFFLATGLVAILFEPLRQRLQRLINRLMYGERDDPYAVLTRLSNTLEQSLMPGEMLPAIANMVGQGLKVPYVSIQVTEEEKERTVAVYGAQNMDTISFPLVYQGETVGSLRVAERARGEAFSTADRRLIQNIARQAGAVVRAVSLTDQLIHSRAEIVTAREEERRRLRRDLHDGLGPILASQTLKMAAVRQLVRQNPARAESMADDLIHQIENTVTEVRRLVYGLRPPALDELGLVEAVRDLIHRTGKEDLSGSEMAIQVSGPGEGLPKLPAAVEVNAYRIALEALTNAARHSHARHCTILFRCEGEQQDGKQQPALLVQVSDDGVGMPDAYRAGVGLRSMRERAEELGGRLNILAEKTGGTQIMAWLPLVDWERNGQERA